MKQKTANIIITVISALIMCAVTIAAVWYSEGYFDKAPDTTEKATEKTTDPADTETETGSVTEELITDPPETTGDTENPDNYEKMISQYDMIGEGYVPTDLAYDASNMKIMRLTGLDLPDSDDPADVMTRKRYNVAYSGKLRVYTEVEMHEMRHAVDVYMDYIVVSRGGKLSFYSGKGEILYVYEGEEELVFAYERDKEDRALFKLDGKYYYIDEEEKTLKESDYDHRDNRGLYYNYPKSFGKYENQFTAFRSKNSYGILKTDGSKLKNAIYEAAYNYSEGLGLVIYKGDVCYLNEKGKAVVNDYLTVGSPDENGIGAVYFDHGCVRMRKIKYDPVRKDTVIEDSDVLVDREGNEYEMPNGCTFVSYSYERILVKKNGRFGFYALKGAWIADTVYLSAKPYYEGLAVVGDGSMKGVIDLDGNFVIPLAYKEISVCSGGVFVCYSEAHGYDIFVKAVKQTGE